MTKIFVFKQGGPEMDPSVAAQVAECANGGFVVSSNGCMDFRSQYRHFGTLEELEQHLLGLLRDSIRATFGPKPGVTPSPEPPPSIPRATLHIP